MALPPIGYKSLRNGRVSEAGRLYFVTKTCEQRLAEDASPEQQLARGRLVQPGVPEIIMGSLAWLQERQLIILVAYCLMPDHLHLLFKLGEKAELQNVMKRFGSFTGLEVYKRTGRGSLWSEGFHDHALRMETEIEKIVQYIEYNPVTAGLVEEAADWNWSSRQSTGGAASYIVPSYNDE